MKPTPYATGDIVSYRGFNYAVRNYNAERDRLVLWRHEEHAGATEEQVAVDANYHGQEINADDVILVQRTIGMSGSAMDELFSGDLAKEAALVGQPTHWTFEALHRKIVKQHDAIGQFDTLVVGDRVFRPTSTTIEAIETASMPLRRADRRNGTGGETVDGRVEDWLKTRRRGDAEATRHRYERDATEGRLTWATALTDATARVLVEDEPARLREELVALAGMTLAWIETLESP